jgi:fatty-acyl-CoA synthase
MDLSEWIDRHAGLTPERTAIRFPERDVSYVALAGMVQRLAAAMNASGLERGACVAYLGVNSPEMLALLFACARLGAMFMPLNWRLAGPEHRQMLEQCPPSLLFVEPQFVGQIDAFRTALGPVTAVAFGRALPGWIGYDDFLARAAGPAPRDPGIDPAAPVLICYTSGSTGKPKGVLLSQDALAWNAANCADMHELTPADRILTTLPLFHVGGLNNLTTPALDAIERERITLTVLVPAQLDMMMASPRWQCANFSSLRMITTGSTIVPARVIAAVHAKGVPLVQIYGSTETCPIAVCMKAADARRKAGSAGKAAAHCELRVVDDLGKDVDQGATGEILVRGRNLMNGYWNAPQETAAALADGWFHSGDMGHVDAEGYLYVDGRRKEMIISGGENIYPAEIENVLAECKDIAEASVIGRPDARWGEVVVAVVAPKSGRTLTSAAVLQLLEGRIARYKHPKEVVFVGELPKTALGKVRKEDVRQMVARATGG